MWLRGFILMSMLWGASAEGLSSKKVSIIIYVDRSHSMAKKSQILSDSVEIIAHRLQEACGGYQIAVSGIAYADPKQTGRQLLKIEGSNPRFITEQHGAEGLNRLRERVLWKESKASPFTDEVLFSSVATSIEMESLSLVNSDFVATLLLSDATPTYEDYNATEALEKIYQNIQPNKFMAAGIVPDFSQSLTCSVDSNSKSVEASRNVLEQSKIFFRQSGGDLYNICDNKIRDNVEEFMDLVISHAQCLYLM